MPNQQQILKSIAAVAKQLGRASSVSEFVARSGIPKYFVFRYFPTWNEAVRAAGLRPSRMFARPDDIELLQGWGETVRKLRAVPSRRAYRLKGTHSPRTLETRFGCWAAVPQAFRNFAEGKPEWADVLALARKRIWSAAVLPPLLRRNAKNLPDPIIWVVGPGTSKAGATLPHSKEWLHLKVVGYVDAVARKIHHGPKERVIRLPLKPACGTPGIVGRVTHNSVLDWVLVNVVESGEIGTMKRDVRFPVLKPNLSIGGSVLFVDPHCC